jgi:hypothetical protein
LQEDSENARLALPAPEGSRCSGRIRSKFDLDRVQKDVAGRSFDPLPSYILLS